MGGTTTSLKTTSATGRKIDEVNHPQAAHERLTLSKRQLDLRLLLQHGGEWNP
jgi:hypothetical protein